MTEDMRLWSKAIEQAHAEVSRLCCGEDAGRWRMSIPAQPGRDSDLVISAGLEAGGVALAALAAVRVEGARSLAEVDRLRALISRILDYSAFTHTQIEEYRREAGIQP